MALFFLTQTDTHKICRDDRPLKLLQAGVVLTPKLMA
jgi:hypothetical protein